MYEMQGFLGRCEEAPGGGRVEAGWSTRAGGNG